MYWLLTQLDAITQGTPISLAVALTMHKRTIGIGRPRYLAIRILIAGESAPQSMAQLGLGAGTKIYLEDAFVAALRFEKVDLIINSL